MYVMYVESSARMILFTSQISVPSQMACWTFKHANNGHLQLLERGETAEYAVWQACDQVVLKMPVSCVGQMEQQFNGEGQKTGLTVELCAEVLQIRLQPCSQYPFPPDGAPLGIEEDYMLHF